jgi:hypothetical protein
VFAVKKLVLHAQLDHEQAVMENDKFLDNLVYERSHTSCYCFSELAYKALTISAMHIQPTPP